MILPINAMVSKGGRCWITKIVHAKAGQVVQTAQMVNHLNRGSECVMKPRLEQFAALLLCVSLVA
jgi:hypothetical protein